MEIYQDKKAMYKYFFTFKEDFFYFKLTIFSKKTGLSFKRLKRLSDPYECYLLSENALLEIYEKISEHINKNNIRKEQPKYIYKELNELTKEDKLWLLDRYLEFYEDYFHPSERYISSEILQMSNASISKFKNHLQIGVVFFNKLNKFLCELGY